MDNATEKRQRIDALGPTDRLGLFAGNTLRENLDDELQAIVEAAASELGTPIALVSLVLDDVQYFRAHRGLPEDLVRDRSTARDLSFCQFVVRDNKPFAVSHASQDLRVPSGLVEQYGIEAYLGVPLQLAGQTAGSLCVIDVESRSFDADQREALERLADRVNTRMAILATGARDTLVAPHAPAEVALQLVNTVETELATLEIAMRAAPSGPAALDWPSAVGRAASSLAQAGALLGPDADQTETAPGSCNLAGVLQLAIDAHRSTWPTPPTLATPLSSILHVTASVSASLGIASIALALSALRPAQPTAQGQALEIEVEVEPTAATLILGGADAASLHNAAAVLDVVLLGEDVTTRVADGRLHMRFARG